MTRRQIVGECPFCRAAIPMKTLDFMPSSMAPASFICKQCGSRSYLGLKGRLYPGIALVAMVVLHGTLAFLLLKHDKEIYISFIAIPFYMWVSSYAGIRHPDLIKTFKASDMAVRPLGKQLAIFGVVPLLLAAMLISLLIVLNGPGR